AVRAVRPVVVAELIGPAHPPQAALEVLEGGVGHGDLEPLDGHPDLLPSGAGPGRPVGHAPAPYSNTTLTNLGLSARRGRTQSEAKAICVAVRRSIRAPGARLANSTRCTVPVNGKGGR